MGSGLYGKVDGDRGRSVATRQGNRQMVASINSDDVQVTLTVWRDGVSTDDGKILVEVELVPLGMGWIPTRTPTLVLAGRAQLNGDGELMYQSTREVG